MSRSMSLSIGSFPRNKFSTSFPQLSDEEKRSFFTLLKVEESLYSLYYLSKTRVYLSYEEVTSLRALVEFFFPTPDRPGESVMLVSVVDLGSPFFLLLCSLFLELFLTHKILQNYEPTLGYGYVKAPKSFMIEANLKSPWLPVHVDVANICYPVSLFGMHGQCLVGLLLNPHQSSVDRSSSPIFYSNLYSQPPPSRQSLLSTLDYSLNKEDTPTKLYGRSSEFEQVEISFMHSFDYTLDLEELEGKGDTQRTSSTSASMGERRDQRRSSPKHDHVPPSSLSSPHQPLSTSSSSSSSSSTTRVGRRDQRRSSHKHDHVPPSSLSSPHQPLSSSSSSSSSTTKHQCKSLL